MINEEWSFYNKQIVKSTALFIMVSLSSEEILTGRFVKIDKRENTDNLTLSLFCDLIHNFRNLCK